MLPKARGPFLNFPQNSPKTHLKATKELWNTKQDYTHIFRGMSNLFDTFLHFAQFYVSTQTFHTEKVLSRCFSHSTLQCSSMCWEPLCTTMVHVLLEERSRLALCISCLIKSISITCSEHDQPFNRYNLISDQTKMVKCVSRCNFHQVFLPQKWKKLVLRWGLLPRINLHCSLLETSNESRPIAKEN